jgi:hypothetical protein
MDILHVSKVVDTAKEQDNVVFIYHSIEVMNCVLDNLANAGYKWSSGGAVNSQDCLPPYMPGGIRPESRINTYYGQLNYYLGEANSLKLVRVVL